MANWKYDVKDDLARYGGQLVAVTTLPDELRRLELEYQSIKAANTDTTPVQVDEIEGGARGDNGFGSTGK